MEGLKHKYIVGFKEVYKTKSNKVCIVMDYADGGDLAGKIKKHASAKKKIKEDIILDWMTQMCLALKYIHDRKIIHRDIKAQNIFVMSDGTIRFGDFGVARVLASTLERAKTQVGTPYYISPEILKSRGYTSKTDIWSLGVLLFELCALDVPVKAPSLHELYRKITGLRRVPPLPSQYSSSVKDLVASMLKPDASKRPSATDLLAHPALSGRVSKFLNEEEQAEEFKHTALHGFNVLGKASSKKTPSAPSKAPLGRPYSARSNRGGREEVKKAARPGEGGVRVGGVGKRPTPGGVAGRGSADRFVRRGSADGIAGRGAVGSRLAGRGSADKFGGKKPLAKNDQNRPQVQTPKMGMGARKFSAGALHSNKLAPGFSNKNSPRGAKNYNFADKYGKPAPSQTPKMNGGAKKLASKAPARFQRPSSAAQINKNPIGGYHNRNNLGVGGFGGGVNNRRFY